ncbi:hypothetical protein SPURM210S_04780 [Streptomyces purpurascens]
MPAPARHRVHMPGRTPPLLRHQRVDQGRLADSGVPDERGDLAVELLAHPGDGGAVLQFLAAGHDVGGVEVAVQLQQLVGRGEVRLGQHQQRIQAPGIGRDQAAVDQPGPGLRVGQGGDDGQLVGVGDDHALERIVVVRRTAQHRRALLDADDPGEGVLLAGHVAHEGHAVADHGRLAAQLAGLHGHHHPVLHEAGEASPVDGEDEALGGVLVLGPDVRPGPGVPAAGTGADVVLVGVLAVAAHDVIPASYAPSIPVHRSGKSGRVLAVVATFSICTPSTARPMIAPAVAMRWSS